MYTHQYPHQDNTNMKLEMKITKCTGEGQGSCKMCADNGKWNRVWMTLLFKIDGLDGCYCSECTKKILKEGGIHVSNGSDHINTGHGGCGQHDMQGDHSEEVMRR